ncbi:MAG TPA: PP2C family protein-serine/threonine phosphatase, partial [Terracidiphilus sp.]
VGQATPPQGDAPAQTDATPIKFGESLVPLYGPWKFKIGDSPFDPMTEAPLWSEPGYDDSKWETVDLTPRGAADPFTGDPKYVPGWTTKGHAGYWGWAWYRIRVAIVPRPGDQPALETVGWVDDAYQLFDNGALVGSWGKFRGPGQPPIAYFTQPAMFALPQDRSAGQSGAGGIERGRPVTEVLSFRVWMGPVRLSHHPFSGGFHYAPVLGEMKAIAAENHAEWLELIQEYAFSGFSSGLFLLLALVAASLILFDRSDEVYLWVAAALMLAALRECIFSLANWTQLVSIRQFFLALEVLIAPLAIGVWIVLWWKWFQLRRPAWIPKAVAALAVMEMVFELLGENLLYDIPNSTSHIFHASSEVIRLGLLCLLAFVTVKGIREQGREGWLLFPAVVLMAFAQFQSELIELRLHGTFFAYGMVIFYSEAADLVLASVIALLLLRRLALSLRRQRQMALDVKQAQEVQQVLMPKEQARIPGFAIETVYRPARQVGGDFFQIVQHPTNGSALIVAGDVAGKGLKAGMLVALLVGAIRTVTDTSFDPEFVLNVLNRRLIRRGDAQATCLVLHIGVDGEATLANAGHLPPYLNGEPLDMEGALPLGIVETAEPSLLHFQLEPGDTLLLMSDGIVEATNAEGELFGFERIRELLRGKMSAADLAAAAQEFGQEDDISVISVTRTAAVKHASPAEHRTKEPSTDVDFPAASNALRGAHDA